MNMNDETKSSTPEKGQSLNNQINILREELLSCPGLDPSCEAMQLALASLEDVKKIIDVQVQMHQNGTHFLSKDGNGQPSRTEPHHPASRAPVVNEVKSRVANENDSKNVQIDKRKSNVGGQSRSASIFKKILRTLFIDLPLVSLFVITVGTGCLSLVYDEYLGPQLEYMKYTDENRTYDLSYYHRVCPLGQMSTDSAEDLYIGDDFTADECVEHMMVHGASLYRDIISKETAESLRDYIVGRNKRLKPSEEIGVLENENRWSFGIGANDHPSVVKALHEITTHKVVRPALEKIAGSNPGLIEMTAITAGYGATDQFWHPDVVSMGSPAKYVRNFLPSYALFVTLQDTTAEMGATGVCPGTYQCGNEDAVDTCEDFGFQVADDEHVWETGTGILMNQQSFHRGAAHVDPNAPDRVVFIITFSPKRMERGETRMLGQGGSYSTRWDMWGHNLRDLENASVAVIQPWSTLRALGMYKPKNAEWGWDFLSQMSMRCATFGTGFESIEDFMGIVTVPRVFLVDFDETKIPSFSEYFRACIDMWRTWALLVNKIAVASYVTFFSAIGVVALSFSTSFSKKVFRGVFWATIRVTIQYMLISLLAYYIYEFWVRESPWAQEIRNGTYMKAPYMVNEKIESLIEREAVVIDQSSILITDRYNFKFLNALTDAPKYHPGNMKLDSEIRGAEETFRFLNSEDKRILANTIVDNAFESGSNFVVHNDDAIWVPLTLNEARSYVAKELYLQDNPLFASLERESSFLLSTNRYGSSAMEIKFSIVNINTLMDKMYAKASLPTFDIYRSARRLDVKKSSRLFIEKSKPKPVSTLNRLNTSKRDKQHHKTKETVKISPVPRTQSHNKTLSTAPALKVGDVVEGQYNRIFNEWYKGKIVKIHQGAIVDVQYADGDVDRELDSSNVRKFVPYEVGEQLEVINQEGDFVPARIIQKTGGGYVVKTRQRKLTVQEASFRRVI